jgi:hypothetical protein
LEIRTAGGNNTDFKAIKNEDEVKMRNQYGNQQQQEQDIKIKIKKGMKIKLDCEFCKDQLQVIPACLGLQTMDGFSVVMDVCLVTSKNILEE